MLGSPRQPLASVSAINQTQTEAQSPPNTPRLRPRLPAGPRRPSTKPAALNLTEGSTMLTADINRSPSQTPLPATPPALSRTSTSSSARSSKLRPETDVTQSPPTPHTPPLSPLSSPPESFTEVVTKVEKISLPTPPQLSFESVPVPWRGMTLEAAQWTFSSGELQAIVSRAIRRTADESSIRLLPLDTVERELVTELSELETKKIQKQAQYRFQVHRRTMLLQALATSPPNNAEGIAKLASHLAEAAATADQLVAELAHTNDQHAQVVKLLDTHASSALAVALRKLNASYAKRTKEMQDLHARLEAVEAERDDAWRVAEQIAEEFDGEGDDDDYESDGGTFGGQYDDDRENDDNEDYEDGVVEVVNITGRAVATTATYARASTFGIKTPGVGPRHPNGRPRAGSKSSRPNSAASRVSAARTRSVRASKASLRIPKDLVRARNGSISSRASPSGEREKHPPLPVPPLPKGSFLDMGMSPQRKPGSSSRTAWEDSRTRCGDDDEAQVLVAPSLSPPEFRHPFSAGFATERVSMLSSLAFPLSVSPDFDPSDFETADSGRVQSMLSPLRTAPMVSSDDQKPASATRSPRARRPSSAPIPSPLVTKPERPWDYF
ncbi:hypothetical protein BD410DRAFT_528833 [Rickenella mellea]|uniref:Uncharacterized protein n=1 Tax=Rickenella mellea TaxID=50990 RepID=A0A4Y7QG39_9AGAM|nr:hypothetical protein BD410DRAFT_528833 [Rickenella mellea]